VSRPSYSVTVERLMGVDWDISEHIESERDGGKFASLLTARHAAKARLTQGIDQGQRVAIRDSRWEIEHGFHLGHTGRCYKGTYKVLTDTGALL
jgi:hypothetical protein